MTEAEKLLETCIHEAAHFAFCVWAGCPVHQISIGDHDVGGFVSGGHVMWSMREDMSSDDVGAIAAAGSAIDGIREKFSYEEIYQSSGADQAGFGFLLRETIADIDEGTIRNMFLKGLTIATANLNEPSKERQVVCLGEAIFKRCIDGRVVIEGSELQTLFDECRTD